MSEEIVYNLDEIIDFKTTVPVGEYVARVKDVQLGLSKSQKPTLNVNFEIQEGEYGAEELYKSYSLATFTVSQGKNAGAIGCNGLADIREEARRVGEASKLPKKATGAELRKAYAAIFGKKKLVVKKYDEVDKKQTNDDGTPKVWKKISIIGLANKELVHTGTSTSQHDPLADLGL